MGWRTLRRKKHPLRGNAREIAQVMRKHFNAYKAHDPSIGEPFKVAATRMPKHRVATAQPAPHGGFGRPRGWTWPLASFWGSPGNSRASS